MPKRTHEVNSLLKKIIETRSNKTNLSEDDYKRLMRKYKAEYERLLLSDEDNTSTQVVGICLN